MDEFLGKRYKLYRTEGHEELLAELGITYVTRKLGKLFKPTIEMRKLKNGSYSLLFTNFKAFRLAMEFTPGETFTCKALSEHKESSQNCVKFEGNLMIHTQIGYNRLVVIREFFDDQVVVTSNVNNRIESKQWFQLRR